MRKGDTHVKVTAVEATTCIVPLDRGIAFATRAVAERHYTLVRVRTDTGAEGIGFCYGGTRAGRLATLAVRELLRDLVVGRDPHQVEAIWEAMFREALLQGPAGARCCAPSVPSTQALWDVVSREANLPLHRYLGGYRTAMAPAYASGGYYADGKTPGDLAEEVRGYVDRGFTAVKIKVGGVSTTEDAVRIAAAREAVGPGVELFLDANNAWRDAASAIRAVRAWEEWNPGWIEEPLMPDDIDGHARVAAAVATPVATGEIHATRWDFLQLVDRRAAAVLQPATPGSAAASPNGAASRRWLRLTTLPSPPTGSPTCTCTSSRRPPTRRGSSTSPTSACSTSACCSPPPCRSSPAGWPCRPVRDSG